MNPCPNCGSTNTWVDNMHWGCNQCEWCSLARLNTTRTPSAPYTLEPDPTENARRAADWAQYDVAARRPPPPVVVARTPPPVVVARPPPPRFVVAAEMALSPDERAEAKRERMRLRSIMLSGEAAVVRQALEQLVGNPNESNIEGATKACFDMLLVLHGLKP